MVKLTKKQLRAQRDKELAQNKEKAQGAYRSIANRHDLQRLQMRTLHRKENAAHLSKFRTLKKKINNKWTKRIDRAKT